MSCSAELRLKKFYNLVPGYKELVRSVLVLGLRTLVIYVRHKQREKVLKRDARAEI